MEISIRSYKKAKILRICMDIIATEQSRSVAIISMGFVISCKRSHTILIRKIVILYTSYKYLYRLVTEL